MHFPILVKNNIMVDNDYGYFIKRFWIEIIKLSVFNFKLDKHYQNTLVEKKKKRKKKGRRQRVSQAFLLSFILPPFPLTFSSKSDFGLSCKPVVSESPSLV